MLSAALPAVAAVSPVGKVTQMLQDMKSTVEAEVAADEKNYKEEKRNNEDLIRDEKHYITANNKEIATQSAKVEDSNGRIESATGEIQKIAAEVVEVENDRAAATKVRESENSTFKKAEAELIDTIGALENAMVVLKRALTEVGAVSLIQEKKTSSSELRNIVKSLSLVVDASWLSPEQAKVMNAFVQSDDDLSLLSQVPEGPQATQTAYGTDRSQGIIEVLQDMKDKAEEQKHGLTQEEMNAKHQYEMMQQSSGQELESYDKEKSLQAQLKSENEEASAAAQQALTEEQRKKAASESKLATAEQEVKHADEKWARRSATAQDEVKAIAEAIDVLKQGVPNASFVQVTKTTSDNSRSKLVHKLRSLSRKYKSFQLMQLANKAGSDPFGKVRGLIETLIARLAKEAAEEADHESYCQDAAKKGNAQKEKFTRESAKLLARRNKYESQIALTQEKIKDLSSQIASANEDFAAAQKTRNAEHSQYVKDKKEQEEANKAVANAIQILQEFYGSEDRSAAGDASKTDSGNSVISLLEVAQSNWTTLLAETEESEAVALDAFNTFSQETKTQVAVLEKDVEGKKGLLTNAQNSLQATESDMKTVTDQLDAVNEALKSLQAQCVPKAMSYEERKERRENEISGLKEALEILDAEPSTFIQKAFLARHN